MVRRHGVDFSTDLKMGFLGHFGLQIDRFDELVGWLLVSDSVWNLSTGQPSADDGESAWSRTTLRSFMVTVSGWWWLEPWNFMTFHSVGNGIIIPTDELIFFRGVGIPPTRFAIEMMISNG